MSILFGQFARSAVVEVHKAAMPQWLTHLGALGLFSVAIMDSSVIPLPLPGTTDLLLLWLVTHRGNPWVLAASAMAGSLLGGYTTWLVGRKGGELALRRHLSPRLHSRILKWVKGHPILAVFLPAVLPPPIPLSPFVLASGALGIPQNRFLVVFGTARCLRYSLISWLAVSYGRKMVRLWSGTLDKWSAPMLWIFGVLLIGGVCFGVWRLGRQNKTSVAG